MNRTAIRWSVREDEYLVEAYTRLGVSVDEICEHLERTRNAVRMRVQVLGIKRKGKL